MAPGSGCSGCEGEMKTVFQDDQNGCWIASVAMLSGKSYSAIKSRFEFRGEVTGRSAQPLVALLGELGSQCDQKSTKIANVGALRFLDCDALVYFRNVDEDGDELGGHWMVWDYRENAIRDPEGWAADTTLKIKNFLRIKR